METYGNMKTSRQIIWVIWASHHPTVLPRNSWIVWTCASTCASTCAGLQVPAICFHCFHFIHLLQKLWCAHRTIGKGLQHNYQLLVKGFPSQDPQHQLGSPNVLFPFFRVIKLNLKRLHSISFLELFVCYSLYLLTIYMRLLSTPVRISWTPWSGSRKICPSGRESWWQTKYDFTSRTAPKISAGPWWIRAVDLLWISTIETDTSFSR